MRRRSVLVLVAVLFLTASIVVFVSTRSSPSDRASSDRPGTEARAGAGGEEVGEDPNEEAEEQRETVELREEALAEAVAAGRFGVRRPTRGAAAPGWAGESVLTATTDDWEPAIAADPTAPYVYVLATRYGVKPCPGNCPTPWIALAVSTNGGGTWGTPRALCACKGSGQFDPIIEVVPGTGAVYAVYMNGFNVVFTRSTDHGQTWTTPVPTYGNVSWNDKPVMAMSDDGRDVYISWNGPTSGDAWVAQSHDFGATWTQTKVVDSTRYYYAFDADVATNGTVYFAESSLEYGGNSNPRGDVRQHVFISRDRGATWETRLIDTMQLSEPCVSAGCPADFYLGHTALSVDASGKAVLLYDGATTAGGKQFVFARRSTDGGVTWSPRQQLSAAGQQASMPAIESRGAGDVRAWYMEEAGGPDAWNVWYRSSSDGGQTWSAALKISDATSGAAYKTAAGFQEPYGDYGEMAITSLGKVVAVWGEGFSYNGPGGVWINRQT
jgi:hypothetical protein